MAQPLSSHPQLRGDLKIGKRKQGGRISVIVRDPIKDKYFRFDEEEWDIVALFDGNKSREVMIQHYNHTHRRTEIDVETLKDFEDNLNRMDLLVKSKKEQNIMLIEKMREMRKNQLLSKKGSLMYKRFPVVDPDKIFNRIIGKIGFFWTKSFAVFSMSVMLSAVVLVLLNLKEFNEGMAEAFAFSEMSVWNLIFLWVTIYAVIAIHELGHGLTCKYYGGEVHEIGFLLLFFQPCLYCNVNDAWLFDKKWKQVLVTLAGGYIEFFVGSLFCFIWYLTNPNTVIHILSFQVMAVCSLSTILFNFNPLIKLDGYYLLADFLEVPNLRDKSGDYLSYVVKKHIFKMPEDPFNATKREKRIYLAYGFASSLWITSLLVGLVLMAKGLLVDMFHELGLLMTGYIAYKFLGSQVKGGIQFLFKWFIHKKEFFMSKKAKGMAFSGLVLLVLVGFLPVPYHVAVDVELEPSFVEIVRAGSDGQLSEILRRDGEWVEPGQKVGKIENLSVVVNRNVAALAVEKHEYKFRQSLSQGKGRHFQDKKDLEAKRMTLLKKQNEFDSLTLVYQGEQGENGILSCGDQSQKIYQWFKKGDEVCKVLGVQSLKAVVEVSEQEMGYIKTEDWVRFRLPSLPFSTFDGKVTRVREEAAPNKKNPKAKSYKAEILLKNRGDLRPGMTGQAVIVAEKISVLQYIGRKLVGFLRIDLFV